MKLSEAMMLGAAQMPVNDGHSWFGKKGPDFNECGCAIGRAWFAVGRTSEEFNRHNDFAKEWPWLSDKRGITGEVSTLFDKFLRGQITFESIVDYVRSIEPDCGQCNKFDCQCEQGQLAPIGQEVAK